MLRRLLWIALAAIALGSLVWAGLTNPPESENHPPVATEKFTSAAGTGPVG